MSVIRNLCRSLSNLSAAACSTYNLQSTHSGVLVNQVRYVTNYKKLFMPAPGDGKNYRFKVIYPEDGQYTVKPLKMQKLAGRDPETGRIIVGTLGGGAKRNYRWIDWKRHGPTDGTFLEERIMHIQYDPNRSSNIALVASGVNMRYIIAADCMKAGDLIRTSSYIPRIPVRPKEGDAYCIGALPVGTLVHCLELLPGEGSKVIHAAGTCGIIKRSFGENKIVVQLPSKREIALDARCMATVGRVSNIDHHLKHIGSPNRLRWLGYRPRSGLWQRKTGFHGRKIKPLPPIKEITAKKKDTPYTLLTCTNEGPRRPIIPCTNRRT